MYTNNMYWYAVRFFKTKKNYIKQVARILVNFCICHCKITVNFFVPRNCPYFLILVTYVYEVMRWLYHYNKKYLGGLLLQTSKSNDSLHNLSTNCLKSFIRLSLYISY